jgi:hypothetical protein
MRPHGARSARRYRIPARLRARPARALSDHHTANRLERPGRGHGPGHRSVIGIRVHGRTQAPSSGNVHLAAIAFAIWCSPACRSPWRQGAHASRARPRSIGRSHPPERECWISIIPTASESAVACRPPGSLRREVEDFLSASANCRRTLRPGVEARSTWPRQGSLFPSRLAHGAAYAQR